MKNFRKIWTKEMHDFLLENKNENRHTVYQKFLEKFQISDVTFTAFCNERSRIGAVNYHSTHGSTLARPLGFESQKKGYIRVKVAQPNVWIFKQTLIWNQYHPDDTVKKYTEMVIFLNGDKRDFRIENLYKIPRAIASIFNQMGGVVKDNPQMTITHIKQALVKHEIFNRARQFGLLGKSGRFITDERESYRKKMESMTKEEREEFRRKCRENQKRHLEKLRLENPEKYKDLLKRNNERRKTKKEK